MTAFSGAIRTGQLTDTKRLPFRTKAEGDNALTPVRKPQSMGAIRSAAGANPPRQPSATEMLARIGGVELIGTRLYLCDW
jgi:hypothetical protein